MEYQITAQNFEKEVMQSDKPVLLDFWASWCGPCSMLSPVLSEVAKEYEGIVKVGKINVDEEGVLADRFGVNSIPYLVLIRDGKIVRTSIGYQSKEQIESLLK